MPAPLTPLRGCIDAPRRLGVQLPEQVLMYLGAGVAHGAGGDRMLLRQREVCAPAMLPQFGQHTLVPLLALRQHQAKDKQRDQQRVQYALALLPTAVEVATHRHQRIGERAPEIDEGVRWPWHGTAAARHRLAPVPQHRAEALFQRPDEDFFRQPGRTFAPGRAQRRPVRRPVAGAAESLRINEGLDQYRPAAVPRLPVISQPKQH